MMTAYDAWRLRGPDEPHLIGMEDGETCARFHEPCEDAPRGYRPRPCQGVMALGVCGCCLICDTCNEVEFVE